MHSVQPKVCSAYKEIGANGVLLAEPSAGLLPPDWCDEFSSQYVNRLVDAVQDEGFFIVLHNCGYVNKLVKSMVSTGAKGYHFGNAVKMLNIIPQNKDRGTSLGPCIYEIHTAFSLENKKHFTYHIKVISY